MLKMNLHYMVEEAFDKLENAIAYAELHDSTSAADAERYAQLLDDIVGLRDGAKKEAAPAVGATEAEKENTSIPSIQGEREKVKNRLVVEGSGSNFRGEVEANNVMGLVYLYRAAQDSLADAARKNGLSAEILELSAKGLEVETEEVRP
ncbi:MAG: hypothetical protein ACLSD3_13385 [Acutalibacteraceae bacterium]